MANMYRMHVFSETPMYTGDQTPPEPDYTSKLQEIVDGTHEVRDAVNAIDLASPDFDITPVVQAIEAETAVIEGFAAKNEQGLLNAKTAVDQATAVLNLLKDTVEAQTPLLIDAIAQASQADQAHLQAQLTAVIGGLEASLVAEFNESQAKLDEQQQTLLAQNQQLTSILGRLDASPEIEVSRSLDVDSTQGPQEVILPGGWAALDIGSNFQAPDGTVVREGAAFDVELDGHTEKVHKNGEYARSRGTGILGKLVPTLGVRVVIAQAPSTTHIVATYPRSLAPATLAATQISGAEAGGDSTPTSEPAPEPAPAEPSDPNPTPDPFLSNNDTEYVAVSAGLAGTLDLSAPEYAALELIKVGFNALEEVILGNSPLTRLELHQQSSSVPIAVNWANAPNLTFLYGDGNTYVSLPPVSAMTSLEVVNLQYTNLAGALDLSSHASLKDIKVGNTGVTGVTLGQHPGLTSFAINGNGLPADTVDAILVGLQNAGLVSPANIRVDGNDEVTQAGVDAIAALRAAGHTVLANEPAAPAVDLSEMVENLYESSTGAPYADDLQGLYDAIQSGSTFVDVTSGPDGALVDEDGDGTGDRQISQEEYDALAAATQTDIDALIA